MWNNHQLFDFRCAIIGGVSILAAILAGILLLASVYALPTERMRRNASTGIQNYETEGDHYGLAYDLGAVTLDGFTDAIMINNAVYPGSGNPLRDTMMNERLSYPKEEQVDSLAAALCGEDGGKVQSYARYWHGYLLFLKPLLLIFSLSDLRMLNMAVQMLLAFCVLALCYYRGGLRLAIPYCAVILLLNPVSTALCFQFTDIYLLMLGFSAWMLGQKTYEKSWGWMLYLWLGILTAFFDFLTYPLTAMGILLLVELALTEGALKDRIKKVLFHSVAWVFGYGGMWAGKWIAATVITGKNILDNALGAAANRTSSVADGKKIDALRTIWHNVRLYLNPAVFLLLLCLLVLLIFLYRRETLTVQVDKAKLIPMAFVGMYPIIWYCCLQNHSIVHSFMTHKNLVIMAMAFLCMATNSLKSSAVGTNLVV